MHRIAEEGGRKGGCRSKVVKQCAQRLHLPVAGTIDGMNLVWGCLRLLTHAESDLQDHSRQKAASSSQQRGDLRTSRTVGLGNVWCALAQPLLPAYPIRQARGPGRPILQVGRCHEVQRWRHPLAWSWLAEAPNNDCAIITTKRKGIAHKVYWPDLLKRVTAAHQVKFGESLVWLFIPRMWEEWVYTVSSML
jgi:hypothetical protein